MKSRWSKVGGWKGLLPCAVRCYWCYWCYRRRGLKRAARAGVLIGPQLNLKR